MFNGMSKNVLSSAKVLQKYDIHKFALQIYAKIMIIPLLGISMSKSTFAAEPRLFMLPSAWFF